MFNTSYEHYIIDLVTANTNAVPLHIKFHKMLDEICNYNQYKENDFISNKNKYLSEFVGFSNSLFNTPVYNIHNILKYSCVESLNINKDMKNSDNIEYMILYYYRDFCLY